MLGICCKKWNLKFLPKPPMILMVVLRHYVCQVAQQLAAKKLMITRNYISVFGARGLAYIKINAEGKEGLQSPILKFLPDASIKGILERTQAKVGDIIFFGADKANIVNESLGALRLKVGQDRGLVEEGWRILWVVDFPMFEKGEGRLVCLSSSFYSAKSKYGGGIMTRSHHHAWRVLMTWC